MKHTQFVRLGMGFMIALTILPWQNNMGSEKRHNKTESIPLGIVKLADNDRTDYKTIESQENQKFNYSLSPIDEETNLNKTEAKLKRTLSKHIYVNPSFSH